MLSPCPQKELCGSCIWSDLPYEQQLSTKLAAINSAFAAQKITFPCNEVLASPVTAHYRNRMDFAIDFEGRVGLRQKGKWWRVIDGHCCFISDERIEKAFHQVRDWTKSAGLSYFDRKKHAGLLRYAVIRTSLSQELMLTLVTSLPASEEERNQASAQLASLAELTAAHTLIWERSSEIRDVSFGTEASVISGSGTITENINGISYRISPDAFFQTNSRAACVLMNEVRELLTSTERHGLLLDLFCGTGFFTLACAAQMDRVVGVEIVGDAVRDARVNAALNSSPVEFHHIAAEDFSWSKLQPEVLLLDPPRAGLHPKALKAVLDNKPPYLIYVSCNYEAFAKEMVQLKDTYEPIRSRAIDMFPHTPHVELVSLLRRKG